MTGTAAFTGSGNELDNVITGNTLANTLYGFDGNDILNGGTGADTMVGGLGNDTYIVDTVPGDVIIELANEGIDTVQTALSYNLATSANTANVENLTLTGTGSVSATGNDLDNVLTGNSGANIINGGLGADNMVGLAGNDTYHVDNAGDNVTEAAAAGTDNVQSSISSYTLTDNVENLTLTAASGASTGIGNTSNNTIIGNGFDNTLNAGTAGTDSLQGGLGNDTYIVDHVGVTVVEGAAAGDDTVESSVTYAITDADIENLTLTGSAAINGTGNASVNTIIGNSADNTINGGGNADTLIGGNGNDTYVINNSATLVIEVAAEGTDTVQSSASFALGANVDNLTLTGAAALVGTGNSDANVIVGNTGANTLIGGDGADTLTGGAGKDVFVLTSLADSSTTANDIITDFASFAAVGATNDRINLSAIDASTVGVSNEAFTFISTAAFTGTAGQLRYENNGVDTTFVLGDVDGDAIADFSIQLSGLQTLGAADFMLVSD